ncbi:hypothetical protein [Streptomyces sp. NPDC046712]|uniref:hypothetical protein n=1 Tax=Streptomyces sp. NPDC046712 TaxID=3154802 RepID=UPI0033F86138
MGKWIVVAQYVGTGDAYRTEVLRQVDGTREDALDALVAVARTYREPMREKRRQVFRLPGGASFLVIVKGLASETKIMISVAEMVWDSKDPEIAKAVDGEDAARFAPPSSAPTPEDAAPSQ